MTGKGQPGLPEEPETRGRTMGSLLDIFHLNRQKSCRGHIWKHLVWTPPGHLSQSFTRNPTFWSVGSIHAKAPAFGGADPPSLTPDQGQMYKLPMSRGGLTASEQQQDERPSDLMDRLTHLTATTVTLCPSGCTERACNSL